MPRKKKHKERGRWTSAKKMEIVLQLLKGESLENLARENNLTAARISQWREDFLQGGQTALKSRKPDLRDQEIERLRRKVGELTMDVDILKAFKELREGKRPPSVGEVEQLSQVLASHNKPVPLARLTDCLGVARSSVYHARALKSRDQTGDWKPQKRGPKTEFSDEALTLEIRKVIEDSPWTGEGYRKIWARLRHKGIRASQRRVLRLMRESNLLAPQRARRNSKSKAHDGTIVTERPDELWGTDATSTLTVEGNATIFFVIDHCTAECLGIHAARHGTRFEALEALRQSVKHSFGRFGENVASEALGLRHDHGSQFTSHDYQDELKFLGIRSSPAFVGEPECNGVAERFVRTLKEQLLWLERFESVEALRLGLLDFRDRYNREWLIQRHGHKTPWEKRCEFGGEEKVAA